MNINHPAVSKINYLSLGILVIGVINTLGWISPEWQKHELTAATIFLPVAIGVARTWFTHKGDA